jgi:type II secretory pathway predicted ATPase ExeA
MLEPYFGFRQDPFGVTPDPRILYPSLSHREAMASLRYGFYSNRGFTALIAPPGMGKTTLLFDSLDRIRESARSVFVFDTQCEPEELIGYILRDLGIAPGRDRVEMHEQLHGVLVAEARAGRRFVLVIDEAQNLSDTALETVRLLTNFETPQAKLMQIVLAGQPQLSEKLMSPSLVQLRQRISTICRLEPLSNQEIRAYIGFRLAVAGYKGPSLFTEGALTLIFEGSQGIPRRINNLCFNALSLCCALKRKQVDGAMVTETVADQQLPSQGREAVPAPIENTAAGPNEEKHPTHRCRQARLWIPALAAMLILSAFAAPGVSRYYKMRNAPPTQLQTDTQSTLSQLTMTSSKTEEIVAGSPRPETFEITVRAQESLSDIAVQHLGSFDTELLHEIQLLNPNITDPNIIQPGQKIRLPNRSTPSGAEHMTSSNARNLP